MRIPFSPPPGLVSDDTQFAAEGAYADASLVRFWRGRPQVVGGWQRMLASGALDGVCRAVLPWVDNSSVLNTAFGTNARLYVVQDGVANDITPAAPSGPTPGFTPGNAHYAPGGGYGSGAYGAGGYGASSATASAPLTWSLSAYGQSLIANPRGQPIFQWSNNPATPAQLVRNAPVTVAFALVTPQRQLLAFGCEEEVSGVFNPMCIRGSDIEDTTKWATGADNNCFEHVLEGGGRIVAARVVGSSLFVWTDHSLFVGTFVGQPNQTYRFDRVGEHCGLHGPNAAVVVGQRAFWWSSNGQFFQCGLGGEPQVMVSPIQAAVAANLAADQRDKIVCASIAQFQEVWWFYPDARDGLENSRYVAVSLDSGAWTRGRLARTAFVDAAPQPTPIGVDDAGVRYVHETGQSADGAALSWFIESTAQYVGDGDRRVTLKGLWPDFQNQAGAVNLTLYLRDYPQAPERSKGPFAIAPGQSMRGFLADARVARVRFEGSSAPASVRFGKPEFEVSPSGAR